MSRGSGVKDRGFTLLEALFAVAIFGIALATFFGLLPFSLASTRHANIYLQAVSASQEYLDSMRAAVEQSKPLPGPKTVPIDGGESVMGTGTSNASPGVFNLNGSCTPVPTFTRLQHCIVNVTWTESGAARSYSVESYATQQIS